jgi:hypothetical protein
MLNPWLKFVFVCVSLAQIHCRQGKWMSHHQDTKGEEDANVFSIEYVYATIFQ